MRRLRLTAILSVLFVLVAGLSAPNQVSADIEVTPRTHDFGPVKLGDTKSVVITVENIPVIVNEPLIVEDVILEFGSPEYAITDKPASFPVVLNPGESFEIEVTFSPVSSGNKKGILLVNSNDPLFPIMDVLFDGIGSETIIEVTPSEYDFGNVLVGDSATTIVTIQNTNGHFLTIWDVSFAVGSDADIVITRLDVMPVVLDWDGNNITEVEITFAPETNGYKTAVLVIVSDDAYNPVITVPLEGNGLATIIDVTPSEHHFGTMAVGSSVSTVFTISNVSGDPQQEILSVFAAQMSSNSDPDFVITGNPAPVSLGPDESVDVEVTFTPSDVGYKTAKLWIVSNDPVQGLVEVTLEGICSETIIEVTPLGYDFGNVTVGHSATSVVTIQNTNGHILTVTGISLTGNSDPDFSITSSPTLPAFLDWNGTSSAEVEITFSPQAEGYKTTFLVIVSDDLVYPAILVPLSGEGVMPGAQNWRTLVGPVGRSSPAVGSDGTIYVGTLTGTVAAIDGEGNWKAGGGMNWPFWSGGPVHSSPAIGDDGTIYVGSESYKLWAIDPTGDPKWNFPTEAPVYCSPAIGSDGTIYVGAGNKFYAINPNGTQKWVFDTGDYEASSPAVGPDGVVYFGAGPFVVALNPDKTVKWVFQTQDWDLVSTSPAIGSDGTIYVGAGNNLYAFNFNDSSAGWSDPFPTGGPVISSPVIGSDGSVYVGSSDGNLYAINPDGTARWPTPFQTGGPVHSSPAVGSDGTIVVGSWDGYLYAVNPDSSLLWMFQTDGIVLSSPAIAPNGDIYFASWEGETEGYLYSVASSSTGLANAPWPMFHHDLKHTGRIDTLINTLVGGYIIVEPIDTRTSTSPATVTFEYVNEAGSTTLNTSDQGDPPPPNFMQLSPPFYCDLETTAKYEGTIEVCFDYSTINHINEDNLRVFHLENGGWSDRTVSQDTAKHVICASVGTFSTFAIFEYELLEVKIDIKPGSHPNSINPKSKGKIPVAIISTEDFYAPAEVDAESLTFGATGDEDSLAFCNLSPEDVNGDGYDDIVCHFYTQQTGFKCGDEEGILKGQTMDEIPIEGSDAVRIVPSACKDEKKTKKDKKK